MKGNLIEKATQKTTKMMRMMWKRKMKTRHWNRRSRNDMGRTELLGYALEKKGVQEEVEVEGADALSFQLHHHTSHLLVSPEGEYSHTKDLLSFFFWLGRGFLVARREASVERMGVVEEAWRLSVLGLVVGLLEAAVACLWLWSFGD